MSSKGSSDSLPPKTKKDKTKKESKKEKKEKSKKRHSKDLDKDVDVEIEGHQDGSSPQTKKTFGMFSRLGSGRKSSKSDKRGSKHGSSDSLKNSSEFERRGSEFSLEDSTASAEVSTTSSEVSATISEVSTTSTEVSMTSSKVSTTSTGVPATSSEVSAASAEVEIAKPQSGRKASNDAEREGESFVVEKTSEVKIIRTVHTDLAEDKDIKTPGTKPAGEDDSSPKEDIVSEKLAKEALKEESVSFQEQTPVASKSQTFEFKLQSSVILSEANKNEEENEQLAEESKKESVQLKIEENVSTHEKKDQVEVEAPESGRKYEVSLEDIKTKQDHEVTSSEDESVDTVISTEFQNTGAVIAETTEEIEIRSKFDVEEPILSTYHERKGPLQEADQEQPTPIDEDAIVLGYENKTQEEIREEEHVQEVPIIIASKDKRQDVLQSEITVQDEPLTETEPVLLIKDEVKKNIKIHGEAQGPEEELLMPTYVERKDNNIDEEQEEQEAPVNVEAVVLSYPDKEEDQVQNESQDGLVTDEEEPVVLETTEKKESQFQAQVDEFLNLDANNNERSAQKRVETAKKGELVETSSHASSVKIRREPSPFDEKSTFITSTPKSESTDNQQGKRKDQEVYRASPAVSYGITRFKGISVVEFQLKVQMVNNIKNVKMCTKALLAQLVEINKKLRTLQKELVEIQKNDSDQEPEIVNTEDA